jgi:hypothetical protein
LFRVCILILQELLNYYTTEPQSIDSYQQISCWWLKPICCIVVFMLL